MAVRPLHGLALCSGVGGLELGLRLVLPGYRAVCHVERDSFAASVLVARMEEKALDPAPVWDDLTTFDGRPWRNKVDIVTAGFPCQFFSTASRGRIRAENLWPEVDRVVGESGPGWGFFENVQERAVYEAERSLSRHGYTSIYDRFCPSELGAPFERVRWFLLAHLDDEGKPAISFDAEVASLQETPGAGWWEEDPGPLLGASDGLPGRMDRLRALGNAVVPLQAAHAFRTLASRLK